MMDYHSPKYPTTLLALLAPKEERSHPSRGRSKDAECWVWGFFNSEGNEEGKRERRRRSAVSARLSRNGFPGAGPQPGWRRPAAGTSETSPAHPSGRRQRAGGGGAGPPAHTPPGPPARTPRAAKSRSARAESLQEKAERRNARLPGPTARQEHARGGPPDNRLGLSAERPRGGGRGGRGGDTLTLSHSHSRARPRLLFLRGPRAQVGATQQPPARPHPARPLGLGAQPGGARPAPPRPRRPRRPPRSGSRPLRGRRGLARPSPATPPPGRPRARSRRARRPRARQPATFPARRRRRRPRAGGAGPGGGQAWTHFFGCFSLFGLRFRA